MGCYTHSLALGLQIVALAFLIIATITVPATSSLRLGYDNNYSFGVLGYCKDDSCSKAAVGYALASKLTGSTAVKEDVIDTLTKVLIVAPIAGGLTLISCLLNVTAHISSRISRSSTFWVIMILLSILCFVGSALLCIVAFLLFYPKVDWPSWLLIPAAVINMASAVLFGLTKKLMISPDDSFTEKEAASTFNDYQSYSEKQFAFDGVGPDKSGERNYKYNNPRFNAYPSDLESNVRQPLNFVDEKEACSVQTTELTGISKVASSVSSSRPNYESTKTDLGSELNNSLSDLKLPSITNPYVESTEFVDKGSQLSINNTESQPPLRSVSDGSTESNFTSISQRGVNPRYYTGAPNKPIITNRHHQAPTWQMQQQQSPMRYDSMPHQQPINGGDFYNQSHNRNVAYNQMPPQLYNQGPVLQRNGYMQNSKPYPPINSRGPPQNIGYPPHQQQPLQQGSYNHQPHNYYNPMPMKVIPNNRAHRNGGRPTIPPASRMNDGPYGII